jgi:hypothetical protein
VISGWGGKYASIDLTSNEWGNDIEAKKTEMS